MKWKDFIFYSGLWIFPIILALMIYIVKMNIFNWNPTKTNDYLILIVFSLIPSIILYIGNLKKKMNGQKDFSFNKVVRFSNTDSYTPSKNRAMYPPIPNEHLSPYLSDDIMLGVYEGNIVTVPHDEHHTYHMLMCGAPGTGKSTQIISNCIQNFNITIDHPEPPYQFICIDIKQEIGNLSVKNLRDSEYAVVFNPTVRNYGWDVYESLSYANLGRAPTEDEILDCVTVIADALVVSYNDKNKYFTESAKDLLKGCLIHDYMNGIDFIDSIIALTENSIFQKITEYVEDCPPGSLPRKFLANMAGDTTEAQQNIISTVRLAIQPFSTSNNLIFNLRDNPQKIKISKLLKTGQSLFISVEEKDLSKYSGLFRLIIAQTLKAIERRDVSEGKPTILLIDEAYRIGKISDLSNSLATLRSRKCSIWIIVQSFSQLEELYGKEAARSIIDNCRIKCILSCSDPDSAKMISGWAGEFIEEKNSYKKGGLSGTKEHSFTDEHRKVMDEKDLLLLSYENEQILFIDGNYFRTDKIMYHAYPELNTLAKRNLISNSLTNN